MSLKQAVLDVVGRMPDQSSCDEIIEQIQILAALEESRADLEAGRVVSNDEVMRKFETCRNAMK